MQVLGPSLECHFGSSEGPGVFNFGHAADCRLWTFPWRVDWSRSLQGSWHSVAFCRARGAWTTSWCEGCYLRASLEYSALCQQCDTAHRVEQELQDLLQDKPDGLRELAVLDVH